MARRETTPKFNSDTANRHSRVTLLCYSTDTESAITQDSLQEGFQNISTISEDWNRSKDNHPTLLFGLVLRFPSRLGHFGLIDPYRGLVPCTLP